MSSVQIAFVLPSIKISGGQREALRIADDVQGPSVSSRLVTMWLTDSPMPTGLPISPLSSWMTRIQWAALQVPALCLRFHRLVAHLRGDPRPVRVWVFTHYATLILAPFVPRSQRWFFVQGVEWLFVRNPLLSRMLRLFISTVYQSGRVIAANPYLTNVLIENDIPVAAEKFIWADAAFFTPSRSAKDIDLVMVLRKGKAKRLDLYAEFLAQVRQRAGRRIAFITPDDEVVLHFKDQADHHLLRPTLEQMRALYARSAFFLMLSEHEGFGLPPLESMGSGCIPICRDSGGVHAYMTGRLERHVLPIDWPVDRLVEHFERSAADAAALEADQAEARRIFGEGLQRATVSSTQVAHLLAQHACASLT